MKKYLILFFFISSLSTAFAQGKELPYYIQWGQELKEPSGTFLSKIIMSNADHFYALREKASKIPGEGPSKIYIEKYNKQMKLLKSKAIDIKFKGKFLLWVLVSLRYVWHSWMRAVTCPMMAAVL